MGDTFTLEESPEGEYEIIPEDTILEAEVGKVQTVPTKMIDEQTGEPVKQVEFTFIIKDEPYVGRKAWGRTSTKFTTHENCKLRGWVTEILAVDALPTGFRLDTDALVGSRARIVLEVNSWEDKKSGETKSNNRVKEVIRSRSASKATAEEPF